MAHLKAHLPQPSPESTHGTNNALRNVAEGFNNQYDKYYAEVESEFVLYVVSAFAF
jgi:hypothetical protein